MAGLRVRVFERRGMVGGACVTEEFHPGFFNSTAAYTVSLLQPKVISARKIAVSRRRRLGLCVSNLELMGEKAEHLVLLGPCGGQVGEAGNAHAMRKSTVNRRFDEIGREERKRDRHVDLADAAPLSLRDAFRGRG
jgi:hypothetical protein